MDEIKGIRIVSLTGEKEYGIEDSEAREELANVLDGAPEELDSFKEAFEAFKEGGEVLAGINTAVEANAKAIEDEAKRAAASEEGLEADITAEAARATMRENELESGYNAAVAAETARAQAAEATQAAALTQEVQRAQAAEKANADAIVAEKTRAEAAETKAKEDAVTLALRELYVSAGAEYNDSGADKTKTAPWGETVTHKVGHYYLNGLGDITEQQMMEIYNAPHNAIYPLAYTGYANDKNVRTLIFKGTGGHAAFGDAYVASIFNGCLIETLDFNAIFFINCKLDSMFKNCKKLTHIKGIIYCQNCSVNQMFNGCVNLKIVDIQRLSKNVSLSDSAELSKNSVLNMINYAMPTTAITITLHADAFARLKDDADIVAALAAQPLVTLVSA